MKTQPNFRRLTAMFLMSISLLFIGCGSFETVSYYNDGIYGDEAVAVQPAKKTSNGAYYKKYFDEKATEADQSSGGILFTNPNAYTDSDQDVPETTQYQTYGNWGDQADQVNITINGYYPYHYGYTPHYNYYYWDAHYRPWWRHRYRSWYRWSYHYYPSYYYGWYGHHNPYYVYHYYHPSHNRYYSNYGSGVTYSRTKGRRGGASSTSASGYVAPRSVLGYSVDSSTTTSPTAGRSYYIGRDSSGSVQSTGPTTGASSSSSNFMSRDYSAPRVYQRGDGRKAVSAGSSNNMGSSYQVRSYRANTSNNRASQGTRSSNYSQQRSQPTSSPSYNSSSRHSNSTYSSGRSSSSNSSYSSGRSSSSRSSSGGRSSSGSSRSSSSGRR